MGEVAILSVGEGDTKLTFDKNNPAETIRAARIVGDMLRRGPRIYTIRLDTLPNPDKWCKMPMPELMASYRRLKERGKLPQTPRATGRPQPRNRTSSSGIGKR